MSIANEITRLQTAKSDLKKSINAKLTNDFIDDETIEDYSDFVDSIDTNGGTEAPFSTENKISIAGETIQIGDIVYTISGEPSIIFKNNIKRNTGGSSLNGVVYASCFSPDGNLLVLGGEFSGFARLFSVSGTTVTYLEDIFADAGTTALSAAVYCARFSPDGTKLILGGTFTGRAKIYSLSSSSLTYISDIFADAGTTVLSSNVRCISFSPDGTKLLLGGNFNGRAKLYTVSGNNISYLKDIFADAGTTALDDIVYVSEISPLGNSIILGGNFTGRAKIYSLSGTTVTFRSNLYSNTGTTALSDNIRGGKYSPNGNVFILLGKFSNYANVYNINGYEATYSGYLSSNNSNGTLDKDGRDGDFSPNGELFILGGEFTGMAKAYSVSSGTLTYLFDIFADAGTTPLNIGVYGVSVSPTGNKLVLGGDFTDRGKIYSIEGYIEEKTFKYEKGLPLYNELGYATESAFINNSINLKIFIDTK